MTRHNRPVESITVNDLPLDIGAALRKQVSDEERTIRAVTLRALRSYLGLDATEAQPVEVGV